MNYPNPFIESTRFTFEHNQTDQPLEVMIRIYAMNGRLVRTLTDQYFADGYKYNSFAWNGEDEGGYKLDQGMYIYKVLVRSNDGEVSEETSKLVILR
jgi:flagellar hook assembly protein FlgD